MHKELEIGAEVYWNDPDGQDSGWKIIQGFREIGNSAELIGTGQTAWMQGARYHLLLDSLVNAFVSGEIEHTVCRAWNERRPDVIVIEGQGSLMNPAYPGGFEILAAGRPDVIVLQHAPARKDYDGFPGHAIHPLSQQIHVIEQISGKPVGAITINHEGIPGDQIPTVCTAIEMVCGIPAVDVIEQGPERLVDVLSIHMNDLKEIP